MTPRRQARAETSGEVPDRHYRNPPVVEALCEFYFSDSEWDDAIPGIFYERIKRDYPTKQQRKIQEAQITISPQHATAGVRQLAPWMQFISTEKHRMIQVGRDLLVINQLHPYPHFEDWEPEIYRALRIYQELACPKKINRLGLRYINRVVIPEKRIRMEEYFTIYPRLPKSLGGIRGSFLVRVEIPQINEDHTILITFGSANLPDTTPTGAAFLLDIYDIVQVSTAIDEGKLRRQIALAHDNIVAAFEDSITDRLRVLFQEEKAR